MSMGVRSIWRIRSHYTGFLSPRPYRCLAPANKLPNHNLQYLSTHATTEPSPPVANDLGYSPESQPIEPPRTRNQFFRDAFRDKSPEIDDAVARKLGSVLVPPARIYGSKSATQQSFAESTRAARTQVGFDILWEHFSTRVPEWRETFGLLKRLTPERSKRPKMAAVRIVLPQSWDLAVESQKVEFVDSTTGIATRLRLSADKNPSAIVLRGKSSMLAKAADELVAACKDVEVFSLGEVAASDYEMKQLWPAIEGAHSSGEDIPPGAQEDSIWVHRERQAYWIEHPYGQTPKPSNWTKESFEDYITTLVCGRLRPDLISQFYHQPRQHGRFVDTDGIRIRLMLDAFQDATARTSITLPILKMAMQFMVHRGGHRASADRLLTLAEKWGLPLDTDAYNILLEGYVAKRDITYFHKFLSKMKHRYFPPNGRTWVLFLELVQREEERKQIIKTIHNLGFFEDPAIRRGIARVMAEHDAYAAFSANKTVDEFLAEQAVRYSDDWYTVGALNAILREFFRHQSSKSDRNDFNSFKPLLDKQSEDSRSIDISTFNLVLEQCAAPGLSNWTCALWALSRISELGLEPNAETYRCLLVLAERLRSPASFAAIAFYGTLERKLQKPARRLIGTMMLGQHRSRFWQMNRPRLLNDKMALALKDRPVSSGSNAVRGLEWAILSNYKGYEPVEPLEKVLRYAHWSKDKATRTLYDNEKAPVATSPESTVDEGEIAIESTQIAPFVVRLQRPGPPHDGISVRFTNEFDPDTMVRSSSRNEAYEEDEM